MSPRDLVQASDAELVTLVRAGRDDAFDVLYRRHAARVAGVCRRRVRASEVDDLVQDVFLRAHAHLDQLRDPAAVGAWLRTIAVRCCAERHRGSGPAVVDVDDDVIVLYDAAVPVDEHVVRQEDAAAVHRNLRSLSVRDREALWLRDALDVPISDIAARFGTTEGSTRVMLTRARRRMKATYVAAIAWLVALGRGKFDRAAEFAPVAAGVVAANALVLAFIVGVTDGPAARQQVPVEAAPRIEVGSTPTAAPLPSASTARTAVTSMAEGTLAPSVSQPDSTETRIQVGDTGIGREEAPPGADTWELTVDDQHGLQVAGVSVASSSDDATSSDDEDEGDAEDDGRSDERDVLGCVVDLLATGSCG